MSRYHLRLCGVWFRRPLGAWAPLIGAMADVAVPLIATKHAYVVTERIEGIQGMPNVRDHDSSLYLKLQGDALSVGGYENDPVFIDQVLLHQLCSLFRTNVDLSRVVLVEYYRDGGGSLTFCARGLLSHET